MYYYKYIPIHTYTQVLSVWSILYKNTNFLLVCYMLKSHTHTLTHTYTRTHTHTKPSCDHVYYIYHIFALYIVYMRFIDVYLKREIKVDYFFK